MADLANCLYFSFHRGGFDEVFELTQPLGRTDWHGGDKEIMRELRKPSDWEI